MRGAMASASSHPALASLLRQTTLDDHEEILKASNGVLKKSKTDLEAQHAKLVALLKLDRYEDALRWLDQAGDKLRDRAPFEEAYALYKVGRFRDAEKLTGRLSRHESRGVQHVEAQTVCWAFFLDNQTLTDARLIVWRTLPRPQQSTVPSPREMPRRTERRATFASTAVPRQRSCNGQDRLLWWRRRSPAEKTWKLLRPPTMLRVRASREESSSRRPFCCRELEVGVGAGAQILR